MASEFVLIVQDAQGPICRGFASSIEEAKDKAQALADEYGYECFVWKGGELCRCAPQKERAAA